MTHTRRPDYQHSKDSLKFLLGTMAITEQQMCPQTPFSVIQCVWSQPRHSNPICVTVMHKAHTAHTAHNAHTAHKSHTAQRPSLCPPPTSSVVPTASSDQTPPRRCPPNVSVPDRPSLCPPPPPPPPLCMCSVSDLPAIAHGVSSCSCGSFQTSPWRYFRAPVRKFLQQMKETRSEDFFLSVCVYTKS